MRLGAAISATVLALACAFVACSSEKLPLADGTTDGGPGGGGDRCATPNDNCACADPGKTVDCGKVVRQAGNYVACSYGKRSCEGGRWGQCIGADGTVASTLVNVGGGLTIKGLGSASGCGNPCDPACSNYVDTPAGIDAGGFSVTEGGISPTGTISDGGGGPCTNFKCKVSACTPATKTTITGKVYDPDGTRPVYNVIVYVPNASMTAPFGVSAFTPGVACDTVTSLVSGQPMAAAITGADGSFTLPDVPDTVAFPVVIQVGRWRRTIMVGPLTACTSNALPATTLRLPRNQGEGDIPLMAIMTGNQDDTACLIRKMGVDASEITTPAGTGRVHIYVRNGGTSNGGARSWSAPGAPSWSTLMDNPGTLDDYQAVIAPCSGSGSGLGGLPSAARRSNMANFLNAGGRLFSTHWEGRDWVTQGTAPLPTVANWESTATWDNDRAGTPGANPVLTANIDTTFPKGLALSDWLVAVRGAPVSQVAMDNWRHNIGSVVPALAQRWVFADTRTAYSSPAIATSVNAGNVVNLMTFNTPVGAAAAAQCGRVVIPEQHVTTGSCGAAMTDGELLLEFALFDATAAITPDAVVPVPPPVTTYGAATFVRDYEGTCPAGQTPIWHFFDRKSITPSDSSLKFEVQTADAQTNLNAAAKVTLETAQAPPADQTATFTSTDVETKLNAAAPAQYSKAWLRVTMTFSPSTDGLAAPTLTEWRQGFTCVDAL